MLPLYTQEDFLSATGKQKLPLQCLCCHSMFFVTKHLIYAALRSNHHSTRDFCSRSCVAQNQQHQVKVSCDHCGSVFCKKLGEMRKTKHNFCSQSCAAKYHNSHKITGTRRSKLEVWLETQLVQRHPDLEWHFNRTDAIEAELDIYIPSLNLAFELNGIFHYEPIYGLENLEKTQGNDHRKMFACAERGIDLCVLDTSHMKLFKENGAQRFLDIIERIISKRLALQPVEPQVDV